MSSVSSVGGGPNLYSFLQSVTASSQGSSTTATSTTTDPIASTDTGSSQPVQGHHHHGHGGGDKGAPFSQIQQSVATALQSAQENGTDPNQAIEDAIAKVFQNNNAATASGTPSTGTTAAATDPDAAQANTPASITPGTTTDPASNSSSLQAFFQTLQSFGVDPQQFHQDFLGAVQGAQNGNVDPSAAFQSFPPGSLIDTTG